MVGNIFNFAELQIKIAINWEAKQSMIQVQIDLILTTFARAQLKGKELG